MGRRAAAAERGAAAAAVAATAPGTARLVVVVRPHWVNGWFLRVAARAAVTVDGVRSPVRWGVETVLSLTPGEHQVAACWTYRGTHADLGRGSVRVVVAAGERVRVEARNGWANHHPLVLRQLAAVDGR